MMKKFLAILLAMMLVLVNVAALALTGEEGQTVYAGETEGEYYLDEEKTTPYNGKVFDGETQVYPVITTETGSSPEDYLPDEDDDYSNNEKIGPDKPISNEAETKTVTLSKAINVEGYKSGETDTGKAPAQYITFDVGDGTVSNNSVELKETDEIPSVSFSELTFAEEDTSEDVTITITGNYPVVGIYEYEVTEHVYADADHTVENVAGVTPASQLLLRVTVIQNQTSGEKEIAGIALRQGAEQIKTDEIENLFESGSLDLTKTVDGNMADQEAEWEFTVEFSSTNTVMSTITVSGDVKMKDEEDNTITSIVPGEGWTSKTVKVYLKHNQTIEFDNIPDGVTYTISESADDRYDAPAYTNETGTIAAKEIQNAAVENVWDETPDTGIELETLPFVLLMGIALVGVMALRRREDY